MESKWIGDRLVDALGDVQANTIFEAMDEGLVGTQLVNIKKNGVIINNLDSSGKIIRP
nr:hypothetical protein RJW52_00360 [Streptococcus suis]